jgi:hypothetical protein
MNKRKYPVEEEIKRGIKNLQKRVIMLLPSVKGIVSYLIEEKITSEQKIELTLDNILDFVQLGYGEEDFKRLNNYYYAINKESSKIYENFLKELTEE